MFAHMGRRAFSSAAIALPLCLTLMTVLAVGAQAAVTTPAPAPSTGTPGTSTAGSITLPSALFLVLFLGASVIAIAIALRFAMTYHRLLISFMGRALSQGVTYDATPVPAATRNLIAALQSPTSPMIIGSASGILGEEMLFHIDPPLLSADGKPLPVTWSVDGKAVRGFTGNVFKHTFKKGKESIIEARAEGISVPLHKVSLTPAAGGHPSLPFAIENWGRLVIMLFGLGVVGALMSIGALSSEAGAGLLGAMLGIGAAAAAGATSETKTKNQPDDGAPNHGKTGNDDGEK